MPLSRKISGGQTPGVPLPPWLKYIQAEYAKIKVNNIKKSVYLTNVVAYFTGGGKQFYPTSNGTVRLTSLNETELHKLELISLDPLRIALQQCIQSNLVEGASTSRNRMSDMKTAMDRLKTEARFASSQPFSSWPQEEQAVWNCFHIPIPNSHPAFRELMRLKGENIRNTSSITGTTGSRGTSMTDFKKYYTAVLNFTDFFKNYYGLTKTQLQTCELPTYDKRRLKLSELRQSFKDSLCTNTPQNSSALTDALKPFLDDPNETPPTSWPLTPAEKTAYSTIPSKQCIPISEPILAAPPEPFLYGGTRNRESLKTRRNRRKRRYYKH